MFHEIPEDIKKRMEYLEQKDHRDRIDGTPRLKRLVKYLLKQGNLYLY